MCSFGSDYNETSVFKVSLCSALSASVASLEFLFTSVFLFALSDISLVSWRCVSYGNSRLHFLLLLHIKSFPKPVSRTSACAAIPHYQTSRPVLNIAGRISMSTATMRFDPRLRPQVEGSLGERLNPKSLPMAVILIIHSMCRDATRKIKLDIQVTW